MVGVCDCTDTMRNGSSALVSKVLYVAYEIALEEFIVVVDCGGWSTNTMSPGANVSVSRTRLS